jgi:hypothetical protein
MTFFEFLGGQQELEAHVDLQVCPLTICPIGTLAYFAVPQSWLRIVAGSVMFYDFLITMPRYEMTHISTHIILTVAVANGACTAARSACFGLAMPAHSSVSLGEP